MAALALAARGFTNAPLLFEIFDYRSCLKITPEHKEMAKQHGEFAFLSFLKNNYSKVIKGDGHQSQSLAQDPGVWDSASAGGERDSPGLVWDIMSWLHLGSLGG